MNPWSEQPPPLAAAHSLPGGHSCSIRSQEVPSPFLVPAPTPDPAALKPGWGTWRAQLSYLVAGEAWPPRVPFCFRKSTGHSSQAQRWRGRRLSAFTTSLCCESDTGVCKPRVIHTTPALVYLAEEQVIQQLVALLPGVDGRLGEQVRALSPPRPTPGPWQPTAEACVQPPSQSLGDLGRVP